MAGIDLIIRGQDGRVVKAGALGGTHDYVRGIEPGQILTHKKSIGWADGDEKHVPSLLWLA